MSYSPVIVNKKEMENDELVDKISSEKVQLNLRLISLETKKLQDQINVISNREDTTEDLITRTNYRQSFLFG